ncbi:MAG: SLOG family protein [Oscillospiraceae bacterium]
MYKNCCFTGHRNISDTDKLREKLENILISLMENGTADFYAGGAVGFDILCEQTVLKLREEYPQTKLHLILPCHEDEQTYGWTAENKAEYHRILLAADSIEYVSAQYTKDCMKKRNARLVELSDCCICYYKTRRSGTGQTVKMAETKGMKIININH